MTQYKVARAPLCVLLYFSFCRARKVYTMGRIPTFLHKNNIG
nr:MAG TPA: glycoprotein [Caudoviricetes sp.]